MANFLSRTDCYFTSEGDFVESPLGDLLSTEGFQYREKIQQVLKRLMSTKGDWVLHPDIGVNLGDFVGLPNTREVGAQIQERIFSELIKNSLFMSRELDVEVFQPLRMRLGFL